MGEHIELHQIASDILLQEKAIPLILDGKDVVAKGRTGSGKTGAFAIPIIQVNSFTPKLSLFCTNINSLFFYEYFFHLFNVSEICIAEVVDGQENGSGAVHTGSDPCPDPRVVETNSRRNCKGEKNQHIFITKSLSHVKKLPLSSGRLSYVLKSS